MNYTPYYFNADQLTRMAAYREAIRAGFYNEGGQVTNLCLRESWLAAKPAQPQAAKP